MERDWGAGGQGLSTTSIWLSYYLSIITYSTRSLGSDLLFHILKYHIPDWQEGPILITFLTLSFCYPQKIADAFHPYQNPFGPGINLLNLLVFVPKGSPQTTCHQSRNSLLAALIPGHYIRLVSFLCPLLQFTLNFNFFFFFFFPREERKRFLIVAQISPKC